MPRNELIDRASHFAFGENWSEFASQVKSEDIDEARLGLSRLLGSDRLDGRRFLDLGSGSGIHSLAACQMGAEKVLAIDLDPDCVSTTRGLLEKYASERRFDVKELSIFDIESLGEDKFDIVYSWGVLHHTGNMRKALGIAASQTASNGLFVFALYRPIWMDWFWRMEKRWYSSAPLAAQKSAQRVYLWLYRLALGLSGRSFSEHVNSYRSNRGMSFYHDVHDWLGGWPYESISAFEIDCLMNELGFECVRTYGSGGKYAGMDTGILGSGCNEYVYQRRSGD